MLPMLKIKPRKTSLSENSNGQMILGKEGKNCKKSSSACSYSYIFDKIAEISSIEKCFWIQSFYEKKLTRNFLCASNDENNDERKII